MDVLTDEQLERSAVVANCRMNRERDLTGSHIYGKEIGFDPLDSLKGRATPARPAAWLDLCCGMGRALIQAARIAHAKGLDVYIVSVDLVGRFDRSVADRGRLRPVVASLSTRRPDHPYHLFAYVHGLHYVGDKPGLVSRPTFVGRAWSTIAA